MMKKYADVTRDEHLPGLRHIFDPHTLRRLFQQRLDNFDRTRYELEHVRMVQFKYKPGRRCEVIFRIRCRERATGAIERQMLSGIVLPDELAKRRFQEERTRQYSRPKVGPAVQLFEDLGLILWGFPNDPKIARLHDIINDEKLKELVVSHAEAFNLPENHSLETIKTQIVKYVPHDRCTLVHRLQFGQNGTNPIHAFFSKTYGRKTDVRPIYRLIQTLWQACTEKESAFLVPKPLLFHPETNTLFFHQLDGRHVLDSMDAADTDDVAVKCGKALAQMQQVPLELTDYKSRQSEYSEFIESKEVVERALPPFKKALHSIEKRIVQLFPTLPELPVVPNHGAFRLSQLMLVDGKIAILDFDGFLMADAILDVASFVTHSLYLAVKEELSFETSKKLIERFCQAYAQHTPWGLAEDVLTWFTACMLISKHAKKYVKLARVNQSAIVGRLVDLSAQLLDGTWKPV